jgi:hypothetical protein
MKYKIDIEILNEAEDCTCNYSCLNDKSECFCDIDYDLGNGKILFLKSAQNVHCRYIVSYGNSFICTCPVRRKIYTLYTR